MLQGMNYRLVEVGRCYGMKIKVEKPKAVRISKELSSLQIIIGNWRIWDISTIWVA